MKKVKYFYLLIECMYCKRILGRKETNRAEDHKKVSSSICEPCYKKAMQGIQEDRDYFAKKCVDMVTKSW